MSHHHKTVEVGGWVLLLAAIAFVLYLFFHKNGQQMLTGGTSVSSSLGGVPVNAGPTVIPTDRSKPSTYVDGSGVIWTWDVTGQQWHPTASQIPIEQGMVF